MTTQNLSTHIQQFMSKRYSEGYTKGVHDQDAALLVENLLELDEAMGLLRYSPDARACANLYWNIFENQADKQLLNAQLKGIGLILEAFPNSEQFQQLILDLEREIATFLDETQLFAPHLAPQAAAYLFAELTRSEEFVISQDAGTLYDSFSDFLKRKKLQTKYDASLARLADQPTQKFLLIRHWLQAFIRENKTEQASTQNFINEVAALLLVGNFKRANIIAVSTEKKLEGMTGSHSVLEKGGKYSLDYHAFMQKMRAYKTQVVPTYQQFTTRKKELTDRFRQQLRLDEFKPRVLSSFVRNELIDKLYLPLIGDNLAKQIGAVGEGKRTDLMGMLLLISPPGYGKTTLMEYIASRLGLIFMKINGPAIGHSVVSLDPSEAGNAAARQELQKLNLAFEMGDNIMIYLDDIQHCHPEFLQKFISLCDGQRKIEGVYKGVSKTYDFRGKKVCVVMAGNPYTESGEKFTIPDMLANRADTYNLGDIIGDSADLFKLSYIQNCLTSNSILNRLAGKSMKDVLTLIRIAETGQREGVEFEANHTGEELNEYISVLQKLLVVRDVVLRVNLEYINSAGQADEYRTEPPFKLQGSYRDMNKLAEKIVPIMNEQELQTLIVSHYIGEAQTLTTGAESNLLKFKEINKLIKPEEAARWAEIKQTFQRNQLLGGAGQDRFGQVIGQMTAIVAGLEGLKEVLEGQQ